MPSIHPALIFCLFFLACKGEKKEEARANAGGPQAPLVDVIIAAPRPQSNTVEVNGSVVANESVQIFPELSGRLVYLNVPDGANVRAGTVLAKINDAELQAQLSKSRVQLELAEKTEARLRQLLTIGGLNQADYDAALNSVNNIRADMELLRAQIAKTVVRAPFSGVLGLRQVSPGAYVTPQTALATLQQVSQLKVDFTVPELYADLIKKGQKVKVFADDRDSSRTATVLATEADINTETRNLKVRASLNGKALNPGSFVKVILESGAQTNNIVVPSNAIIPDADSKKVVVVKGGKGKFTPVETGVRGPGGVEITKGLAVGDSVVVTGVLFVRPNATVKVNSVKTLEELTKEVVQ